MKETGSEPLSEPPEEASSPASEASPPGSVGAAPSAGRTRTTCTAELEADEHMEVKQVTLCSRSAEGKLHNKRDGVLTAEMVSKSVSQLGYIGTGRHYHNLSLHHHDLRDISVLCKYTYLQKLELAHNKIKDLSCVSHMPYLVVLDASHNEISDFFEFKPPKSLKEVNFSYNSLTKMKDLAAFSSLSKLDLDYNNISEIAGLEHCCMLTHLSLAHNKISKISGLDNLPLTHLCLKGNKLENTEGLESLKRLRFLDLCQNGITSLSGLQSSHLLGTINLQKNLINENEEWKHIRDLLLLRDLNLKENPVQDQPDYRPAIIFHLQHLSVLDGETVTAEEKVSSINKYDPPMNVVAAREHMTHLVYQLMQPQVLYDSTLPGADSPYPMLVLTGPQGCGKRELAHRLCQEISQYFAYGICHTTRGPYYGEENGTDYHFVSEEEFQHMILMGKFIQTMQYRGHNYGLSRDAIEEAAREGLACCVHMELEGVFSLKNTCFEPRYVLLIPTMVEKYIQHLKCRGLYTPAQIDAAVSRIELYANTNRQRPGFFDNVIPCDDWEEAFQTLRRIMKEYLLLEEQQENVDNDRASLHNTSPGVGEEPEEKAPSSVLLSATETPAICSPTALDPSNPAYRSYCTKIRAELLSQKSPAPFELASIRRREQLVREAVVGRSPGVYSQLFKSSAQIASSALHNADPDTCDDSSSDDGGSVALSVPSSAGALSGFKEPVDISLPEQSLDTSKGQPVEAQHPTTNELAAVVSPTSERRPGSNVKPILPPIPTGRKTPVAPSPTPSPRPKTNTPTTEEAKTNAERDPTSDQNKEM
uniref:Guanylate kinase-like domain-containing protein n=1 Tax=Gouania willdenowi TaxID=441366 RepID=A0A8C5EPZ1_GOUWI